jgi:UDP-N-acetylmuramyl-tripeptide synthetase
MMLGEILSGVKTASVSGGKDVDIASLSFDSRKVVPGGLFFTLPGSKTDGNRFVRQAVEKGAAAVVSELKIPPAPMSLVRPGSGETPVTWVQAENVFAAMGRAASNFYSDPSSKLCVVGITGTNGKTTTSYFLESIFARAGGVPGVIGTVSHRLRGRILEKAVNTTPFSLDLIRLLARMRDEGGTHVAMETSSHALAAQRVDEIHFDAAILTNLHSDHLDFHKTREEYFEAKAIPTKKPGGRSSTETMRYSRKSGTASSMNAS